MKKLVPGIVVLASFSFVLNAQTYQRQANIMGGGNPNQGKCTIEVVVDGAAQVEIRGNTATLRNLSGRPAQWRRFDCSAPMPVNAANLRVQGIDGRGRQSLIQDPRNSGATIVQIEDRQGGAEGYTFDMMWDARGDYNGAYNGNQNDQRNNPNYDQRNNPNYDQRNNPNYDQRARTTDGRNMPYDERYREQDERYRGMNREGAYYRQYGHGFGTQEAVRVCQTEVARQAMQRFSRVGEIHFMRTTIDDQPGREDWVLGSVDVHRGMRQEIYDFSCSVNFDSGRVRTAQLSAQPRRVERR